MARSPRPCPLRAAPQAHQIERGTAGNHGESSRAHPGPRSAVRPDQPPNRLQMPPASQAESAELSKRSPQEAKHGPPARSEALMREDATVTLSQLLRHLAPVPEGKFPLDALTREAERVACGHWAPTGATPRGEFLRGLYINVISVERVSHIELNQRYDCSTNTVSSSRSSVPKSRTGPRAPGSWMFMVRPRICASRSMTV